MLEILKKKLYGCKSCNNYTDFSEVRIPYSCKLLMQELQCMAIAPRLITTQIFREKTIGGLKYD